MPAKSKSQFKYFEYLKEHPEVAKERGVTENTVNEFTKMNKKRWSKLKEKIGKNGK